MYACVCACMHACVRACVRAWVRVCVSPSCMLCARLVQVKDTFGAAPERVCEGYKDRATKRYSTQPLCVSNYVLTGAWTGMNVFTRMATSTLAFHWAVITAVTADGWSWLTRHAFFRLKPLCALLKDIPSFCAPVCKIGHLGYIMHVQGQVYMECRIVFLTLKECVVREASVVSRSCVPLGCLLSYNTIPI